MSEEIINQDAELEEQNSEVEESEEEEQEETSTEDNSNSDDLESKLKEKEDKIKELEALIVKNKTKNKKKKTQNEDTEDDDNELKSTVSKIQINQDKWEASEELGISPKVVNEFYNEFNRVPTADDLKKPATKGFIEGAKRQYKVKQNTPGNSSGNAQFVNEDFAKLSKEEKQQKFARLVKDQYSK